MGLLPGWCDEAVSKDVVVVVGAERAWKANAVDLNRRRAQCENLAASVDHVAAGVEKDSDTVVAHATRGLLEGFGAHIDEMVEGAREARALRASVIGAERIAVDLEASAIMPLDHFAQQICKRMGAEVGAAASSSLGIATSGLTFRPVRSEEHTSELQSRVDLVCRLLLEKKKEI